jgi:uncharacterized protein involved in oxidation of intracellular sulfur
MKILIIINDTPYGSERAYNALRLGLKLVAAEDVQLRIFLLADAVYCAVKDQKTPDGYFNVSRMLKGLGKAEIKACGSCLTARGLSTDHLMPGISPSTMDELNAWVIDSDKVLTF